jgi:hypothetical protein
MDWNEWELSDLDTAAKAFLEHTYEVSAGPISAFNDTAAALAAEANRDRRIIERARREVLSRVRQNPDRANKQAASLIQRALELGDWDWE